MSYTQNLFNETLQAHGHSVTAVRQKVFHTLELKGAISMNQLVKELRPTVDRASVYRSIALFEALGIVQRLRIGWKYKLELSNSFQEHHHHLTCLSCGQIVSFSEQDKLADLLRTIAQAHCFDLKNHQLELQGICQACQKSA